MFSNIERVLVLGPHADDGELGCGATIARLLEEGKDVHYIIFSTCAESIPEDYSEVAYSNEFKVATSVLGLKPENTYNLNYDVRKFEYVRQNILEDLILFREKIKPDLVLLPSLKDVHQDHYTIAIEGVRAFKKSIIWAYEIVWNNLSLENNLFVSINDKHLETKIKTLLCYRSQHNRSYLKEEFIRSLAVVRGIQGNSKYAETFEIIRQYI